MTHRTEVVAFDINTEISEIINSALEDGYSRIPIFEGDIDEGEIEIGQICSMVKEIETVEQIMKSLV